nr:hypothetical protein [Spirochaetales bacterium]
QPMRMTTVQTLPALGFVDSESSRFSAFRCSSAGRDFIEEACQGYHPFNRTVVDHLGFWVSGHENRVNSDKLRDALSPLTPLKDKAIPLLRERLLQGGRESSEDKFRRRNALAWVEKLRTTKPNQLTWDMRPEEITKSHWHDLKVGALFFRAREAAITVLDALEAHIGNQATGQSYSLKQNIPEPIQPLLMDLKTKAKAFIDAQHHDRDANDFCLECNGTAEDVLRSLVNRDRQVLRTVGDEIKPGPAFLGTGFTPENSSDEIPEDSSNSTGILLPRDISYRMRNLYLLNLDMHGELNQWLNPPDSEAKT